MNMSASVQTHSQNSQSQLSTPTYPNVHQGSGEVTYETAEHWSTMSASYSQSGDRAAALEARQKAVEVYRLLHEKKPDLFEGNLARELLGLSKDLQGNGLIEETFKASQESGILYRHILGNSMEYNRDQKAVWAYNGIRDVSILKVDLSTLIPKFVRGLFQLPRSIMKGVFSTS